MAYFHVPVMLAEVIEYLNPRPGGKYIDCTLGGGGYTDAILKKIGNSGVLVSFDLDRVAVSNAKKKFKQAIDNKNLILVNDNFKNLQNFTEKYREKQQIIGFDGVVFDLGLSSDQLKDRDRGFSFQLDAPLNMSFGAEQARDTAGIVNTYKERDLKKIIREYGEEKFAGKISEHIIRERKKKKIKTTKQLVDIIRMAVPAAYRHKKIHFATKTFQALRVETNQELENLRAALPLALRALKPGGRIIAISYHSLEDRIVKKFFRRESSGCLCPPEAPVCVCGHKPRLKIITRRIITPTKEEIKSNPRGRSAKMRAAEKI